jgi:AcrR family transcriptional regulator
MGMSSRSRMVEGAADLMSRRGLGAASMRDLARHAGTPLGSTYHYFPGGKRQLALEAVRLTDDQVSGRLRETLALGAEEGVRSFLSVWRRILFDSEIEAGCPVLAVAITESRTGETSEAVAAAATAFATWCRLLSERLQLEGASAADAEALALLIVTSVEGSVGVCRAEGSTRALDTLEGLLLTLVKNNLTHD